MTNSKINPKNQKTATDCFREVMIHSMYQYFEDIIAESKERALKQLKEELINKKHGK